MKDRRSLPKEKEKDNIMQHMLIVGKSRSDTVSQIVSWLALLDNRRKQKIAASTLGSPTDSFARKALSSCSTTLIVGK